MLLDRKNRFPINSGPVALARIIARLSAVHELSPYCRPSGSSGHPECLFRDTGMHRKMKSLAADGTEPGRCFNLPSSHFYTILTSDF
jgi:hypothetical protein